MSCTVYEKCPIRSMNTRFSAEGSTLSRRAALQRWALQTRRSRGAMLKNGWIYTENLFRSIQYIIYMLSCHSKFEYIWHCMSFKVNATLYLYKLQSCSIQFPLRRKHTNVRCTFTFSSREMQQMELVCNQRPQRPLCRSGCVKCSWAKL